VGFTFELWCCLQSCCYTTLGSLSLLPALTGGSTLGCSGFSVTCGADEGTHALLLRGLSRLLLLTPLTGGVYVGFAGYTPQPSPHQPAHLQPHSHPAAIGLSSTCCCYCRRSVNDATVFQAGRCASGAPPPPSNERHLADHSVMLTSAVLVRTSCRSLRIRCAPLSPFEHRLAKLPSGKQLLPPNLQPYKQPLPASRLTPCCCIVVLLLPFSGLCV
jgi:hypothetical protein